MTATLQTKTLPIDAIRLDGETQARERLDDKLIARFARCMKRGDEFPPVHVFLEGEHHWLADGFHRLAAHRASGHESVEVVIHLGTPRDAFLYALSTTGARNLTLAERRRCAVRMLRDAEWSRKSDREIGRHCGIDNKTVGKLRSACASEEIPQMHPTHEIDEGNETESRPGDDQGAPDRKADVIPITGGRSRRGRPPAPGPKTKRKALRNGKVYEYTPPEGPRPKHPRLSPKAMSVIRHLPIAKNRQEMKELAALHSPIQLLIAKRLRDGESATVSEARKAILAGAPIDDFTRAYAALMKLPEDDRIRVFRLILPKGDVVRVCNEILGAA